MILVTGGTGLVGAHLLYELVKKGEKVRAIYRDRSKVDALRTFPFYNDEGLFNKIDWVPADILDIPSLNEAFKDVTHVYHSAAYISFNPKDYKKLKRVNTEGTANIVNMCIANKIEKLCYVSTIGAIGNTIDGSEITEETIWNPEAHNNVYAITKYGAEMEVWRGTQEGLKAVIVNPGIILGAGFWKSASGSIFTKVKKGLFFYPPGSTGFVDAKDVADIMIQLMKSDISNERYITIAENLPYKKVLSDIAEELHVKPPKIRISPWVLEILWRLDWFVSIFRSKRVLTKANVTSITQDKFYSNEKIKKDLNFSFRPVKKTISEISSNLK